MRYKLKNMFSNRKTLYLIFSVVLVSVFTLTIAYAALNTVLKITGNAEVVASSWDIYLDNVQLVNGSATSSVPTISNKTTASFSTTLKNPGDYYMFTIDVVNSGSIDAMIDSIKKLPELSSEQAKYLNYVVEYQSGESISTKQLVEANSFVRLKVKVEFRKDLEASNLPSTTETLNLSFTVKYVQSDDNNTNVSINNSGKLVKVVSGDYDTVGSEICIDTECFYVISSTDDDVTMLAKYNLYVGGYMDNGNLIMYESGATGLQDLSMLGVFTGDSSGNGVIKFSKTNYWENDGLKPEYGANYTTYVYDDNSELYIYIDNYKKYLETYDIKIKSARVMEYYELNKLGCVSTNYPFSCLNAPSWLYSTTYWTGTANQPTGIMFVNRDGYVRSYYFGVNKEAGLRPVITILKEYL